MDGYAEISTAYFSMISIYQITMQGQRTRDQILEILREQDGLSREQLCDRGVTYAQVRRQTI